MKCHALNLFYALFLKELRKCGIRSDSGIEVKSFQGKKKKQYFSAKWEMVESDLNIIFLSFCDWKYTCPFQWELCTKEHALPITIIG